MVCGYIDGGLYAINDVIIEMFPHSTSNRGIKESGLFRFIVAKPMKVERVERSTCENVEKYFRLGFLSLVNLVFKGRKKS